MFVVHLGPLFILGLAILGAVPEQGTQDRGVYDELKGFQNGEDDVEDGRVDLFQDPDRDSFFPAHFGGSMERLAADLECLESNSENSIAVELKP